MENSTREILRELMGEFSRLSYIKPEDVPDIPLYMDQITTFMETKLSECKRYPDDKLLTKTMINNYTKNKLIPPPEKKKYSKEHLILLIFVYYLKDFLSIGDIKSILQPLESTHFQNEDALPMQEIYRSVFDLINSQTGYMTKDLLHNWEAAGKTFSTEDSEDADYLRLFAFVCLLSFDVYVKKKMIENVADALTTASDSAAKKNAGAKEKHTETPK